MPSAMPYSHKPTSSTPLLFKPKVLSTTAELQHPIERICSATPLAGGASRAAAGADPPAPTQHHPRFRGGRSSGGGGRRPGGLEPRAGQPAPAVEASGFKRSMPAFLAACQACQSTVPAAMSSQLRPCPGAASFPYCTQVLTALELARQARIAANRAYLAGLGLGPHAMHTGQVGGRVKA